MIKIASIVVFLMGAAIAFGAFYVVRGGGGNGEPAPIETVPTVPVVQAEPPAPAPVELDEYPYLAEVDFDLGDITVVFHGLGSATNPLIIRDQSALRAVKDQVHLSFEEGTIVWAASNTPPTDAIESGLQIFRDETLISTVSCVAQDCDLAMGDHADLADLATPYQLINDSFHDYDTYLATILAISEDPNFMVLDQRPATGYPAERIIPSITLALPTGIVQTAEPFDANAHEAHIRNVITPHLPEGASVEAVHMTSLFPAFVADKDNGEFVTARGQAIPFPGARFLPVTVDISGTDHLSADTFDAITKDTLLTLDVSEPFAEFVTTRLQNSCVDCFFLKTDGPYFQSARPTGQRVENYTLNYYDLREAP